jgi:two-component system, LytTR family, sensor kinase
MKSNTMDISAVLGRRRINQFSRKSALTLSLRASIPFNLALFLGFFSHGVYLHDVIVPVVYLFVCNVILFYILFLFNFKFTQVKWTLWLRGSFLIIGGISIAAAFSVASSTFLSICSNASYMVSEDRFLMLNLVKDLAVFFIVQIATLIVYLSKQEQEAAINYEKLHTENMRIRYEVLKSQIDPHFIFNSLNTLDGLIGMNDEGAHEYLQNFSSVFRYVINNKEITQLSDELSFTESYADMLKIRYGESFNIEYHIDEKYQTWLIMPISLQLLVENAIKHNVVSRNYPLLITVETTADNTIRVKNNIHLKKEPESSAGVGLANLTDRYKLLFQKEVSITQTDVFSVEIPLINPPKN